MTSIVIISLKQMDCVGPLLKLLDEIALLCKYFS
ncbi:hypothetical protein DR83_765 [Francisella tularensis subsp. novicida]|nr:hypothetical protein DR83_765 [Francisella tularensis subsp. novicida]